MSEAAADISARAPAGVRNEGLDALRAALTLLVLFHHTAITYGSQGGWFYIERPPSDAIASKLLTIFCAVNQSYFMGAFFLLAGYFTPAALSKQRSARYFAGRLLRLGLPLSVFGFLIGPLAVSLAATAKGATFSAVYWKLLSHGVFVIGPLWFAFALLIFTGAAIVLRLMFGPPRERPFPSNGVLLAAALATGAAAFAIRLVVPVGVNVVGLQLGYFASYEVLFIAGYLGARSRWLEDMPAAQVRLWRRVTFVALPILPALALFSAVRGDPAGGWNPIAIAYAFWEPLVAWGMIMGLAALFQRRFAALGGFGRALTRRAYAVYVIHPPVLVAIALAWRGVDAPALLKFAVTGSATCAVCFLTAGLLLKLPGVSRVL